MAYEDFPQALDFTDRRERIWTFDPRNPNAMRYQTAPLAAVLNEVAAHIDSYSAKTEFMLLTLFKERNIGTFYKLVMRTKQ